MGQTTTRYPVEHGTFCERCGYDLRSLPIDTACPECGASSRLGVPAAEIVRWAERIVVDLHCICVAEILGLIGAGFAVFLSPRTGIVIALPVLVCSVVALISWKIVLVRYLRRRFRPNFRNVPQRRRDRLERWLLVDTALAMMLIGLLFAWLFV